ncbi:hypothetical protein niasHT_019753 [Heterodera trifolii]|uniref:Uncharacterized protein n=1 Tax=Heterodera trifolii TaxID=157864 RepID=A0ABD2LEE4_9BILA
MALGSIITARAHSSRSISISFSNPIPPPNPAHPSVPCPMPLCPLPILFSLLVALQMIGQTKASEEFGLFVGSPLNEKQTVSGGSSRDIRSLANGRWQLRPGKRASLADFGPLARRTDEGRRIRARRIRKMYALLPPLNNWN